MWATTQVQIVGTELKLLELCEGGVKKAKVSHVLFLERGDIGARKYVGLVQLKHVTT